MLNYPAQCRVEDDVSIGRALSRLLHAVGWKALAFTSAEAFLQTGLQEPPHCLVLDVRLPGMTGFELLEHFAVAGIALPVILITAHALNKMKLQTQAGQFAARRLRHRTATV